MLRRPVLLIAVMTIISSTAFHFSPCLCFPKNTQLLIVHLFLVLFCSLSRPTVSTSINHQNSEQKYSLLHSSSNLISMQLVGQLTTCEAGYYFQWLISLSLPCFLFLFCPPCVLTPYELVHSGYVGMVYSTIWQA